MSEEMKSKKAKIEEFRKLKRLQKILGLITIMISIVITIVADGDITGAIFMFPLGVYLVCAKKVVIDLD